MTTIATDGWTMASDSRLSGEYLDSDYFVKIHRVHRCLIGGAGDPSEFLMWLNWFRHKQRDLDSYPDMSGETGILVLKQDRTVLHYASTPFPISIGLPAAEGSGSHIALGAMDAGASPEEAVRIAIRRDVNSGGRVRTFTL